MAQALSRRAQDPVRRSQIENPLEFKYYNPDEVVDGKTLKEHLRFSVVYWHTFRNPLSDPFGAGTAVRPWDDGTNSVASRSGKAGGFRAVREARRPVLRLPRSRRRAGKVRTKESHANLDEVVKVLKEEQARTGVKLLWGTANLFTNPRYMHGAATSPNVDVFAFAAAQVKKAMEVTHELGGAGLHLLGRPRRVLDPPQHRHETRARPPRPVPPPGRRLQETDRLHRHVPTSSPKPKEPTKHQYDSDAAACLNFLRTYDLLPHFKLNLETNHATLAGHEMMHELQVAIGAGALGSIDANTGDLLLGWDTDQFPTDIYLTTQCMLFILGMGGFTTGRRQLRRQGAPRELRAGRPVPRPHRRHGRLRPRVKIARAILADGRLAAFVKERYRSWDCELGRRVEAGKATFDDLEAYILPKGDAAKNSSGRQEMLENLINEFI